MNGTIRLGIHGNSHLQSKNIDLDRRNGANDGAKVVLWNHTVNADQQRWVIDYVGKWTPPAGPSAPTGPVHLVNHRFKTVGDWDRSNNHLIGYYLHGGQNQQWTFEKDGNGFVIRGVENRNKYLGLSPNNRLNGSQVVLVNHSDRVRWVLQAAEGNTFRIACEDSPGMNLDMSLRGGAANGTKIVLFNHTANAMHQRWELISPGTKITPSPLASNSLTQTVVHAGCYTITSARYKNAMDLNYRNMHVIGYPKHGGDNQVWIFERSGNGYKIRSKGEVKNFLSLNPNRYNNGAKLICSTEANAVTWTVQPAEGNTVRLAVADSVGMNLDMSTWSGNEVVLYSHIVGATNQRWELRRVL